MNKAKAYYVTGNGLVENGTLGCLRVYLAADYEILLEENERLRHALSGAVTRFCANDPARRASDGELDQYLAAGIAATDAESDQLRAEVAALRKDAERYRWLRDEVMLMNGMSTEFRFDSSKFSSLDAAIDAALSAPPRRHGAVSQGARDNE